MELKKFLVYYNNGLVVTNVLILSENSTQARKLFNRDLKKKSFRKNNNIFGDGYITQVVEVKS